MRRRRGGSAPEVWPNRGDSAYESGRRATKPGSHLWGASSRGNLPSEEASNDPPENEVEDYGRGQVLLFDVIDGKESS